MGLGGGMHCLSASSNPMFLYAANYSLAQNLIVFFVAKPTTFQNFTKIHQLICDDRQMEVTQHRGRLRNSERFPSRQELLRLASGLLSASQLSPLIH